jgi:hypothetical protein
MKNKEQIVNVKGLRNYFMNATDSLAVGEYNGVAKGNPQLGLQRIPMEYSHKNLYEPRMLPMLIDQVAVNQIKINVGVFNACVSAAILVFKKINPKVYKNAVKYLAGDRERLLIFLCMMVQFDTCDIKTVSMMSGTFSDAD